MKKTIFPTLLLAVSMTAMFCSCNKKGVSDPFDHFEITYSLETNQDCKDCFDTEWEILCDGKVVESGTFNTISLDGKFTSQELVPNTSIVFRTVPKFGESIPAEIDFLLKYDLCIMAINESGAVADSYSMKEERSYDRKISLATSVDKDNALKDFTIDFDVRSTVKNGKVTFLPSN